MSVYRTKPVQAPVGDLPLFARPVVGPDPCERKHGGPETSVEAWRSLSSEDRAQQREAVFEYIRARGALGATTDECSEALGYEPHMISGRLFELWRAQRVFRLIGTPKARRRTRTGRSAQVNVASEFSAVFPPESIETFHELRRRRA